jgi:diguanylate cyclase
MLFAWLSHRTAVRLAEHKQRLEMMSTRDGMTGVFNRRHWEMLLRNEFEHCRRDHCTATILLIDIDHFKNINDTWGHDVGDEAIIAITRQLQMSVRSGDAIGRFGGDEFAVIMSQTAAESAIAVMSGCMSGWKNCRYRARQKSAAHQRRRCPLGAAVWTLSGMAKGGRRGAV